MKVKDFDVLGGAKGREKRTDWDFYRDGKSCRNTKGLV